MITKRVRCKHPMCSDTDYTVERDWRRGLYALDWRWRDGAWWCPLHGYQDYSEVMRHAVETDKPDDDA